MKKQAFLSAALWLAALAPGMAADASGTWLREDGNHGTYITEDPAYAIGIDDAGYGMTYHFGDGWVSVSETKQNLQLINAPRA